MLMATVFTALYIVFCVFFFNYIIDKKHINLKVNLFIPCVITGFVLRLILSYINMGHSTDMGCFSAWADMLSQNGISNFYSSDSFTDYPPGYMYILTIVGHIKNAFEMTKGVENTIIRLPAMISDLIGAGIIYYICKKRFTKQESGLIGAMYIFNPAVIINSTIWGQVDAVYLVLILLGIYLVYEKKLIPGFVVFALAVLFKPQALILSPVFIFASYEYLFMEGKSKERWINFGIAVIAALAALIIPMIPFGIKDVISQYTDTLGSYAYATVNAFNIWGLLGLNWTALNPIISTFGYVFIILICIVAGFIYFYTKDDSKYFSTAAFLYFATYMLSAKMHERYAFCAIALSFAAFCMTKQRKHFIIYLFLTLSQVINTAWVLFVYDIDPNKYYKGIFVIIASALNIALLLKMLSGYMGKKDFNIFSTPKTDSIEKSAEKMKITRFDVISMVLITGIYSLVALNNLGSMQAPQSNAVISPENVVEIDFGKEYPLANIDFYNVSLPLDDKNSLNIELYDGNDAYVKTLELNDHEVFKWHFETVENLWVKRVVLLTSGEVIVGEMSFKDEMGQKIPMIDIGDMALCDEQDTVPERSDWYTGTYFDEIYHARTAYEFLHGLDVYEWTHPPLGKVFMSAGIKLFKMTPFGWRVTGTVFGIAMLPFIFLFMKKLSSKTAIASVVTIIFAFDFMHFTQTRIATIDVYITFFVILMYYFMYSYYRMSFYDTPLKKTFVPLLVSGICFGLGTACKWTGIYAGAGLCVIFFMSILKRYREYLYARERINSAKKNEELNECENAVGVFGKNTLYTLLFCVLAFVVIPVVIYLASYIPYVMCEGGGLGTIIKNQQDMFTYHGSTVLSSTHPYSSKWYEWIIMKRPIWYFSGDINENLKQGISAFGNPLVWWMGIPAVLFMIYMAVVKKDKNAIFITVGYFAQLIPWMFVDRIVFIYHYFPSTVFLVLAIGYSICVICRKYPKFMRVAYLYAVAVVVMFALFYPVISGAPVNPAWVDKWLRWFGSWVLV